jgi:large subunit ribosomal protein L15
MPLIRRLPKRGFINPYKVRSQVVNVGDLSGLEAGDISPATLFAAGLVGRPDEPVKILGTGDAAKAYVVKGCLISASARQKIEQAGGRIES